MGNVSGVDMSFKSEHEETSRNLRVCPGITSSQRHDTVLAWLKEAPG
jgi:hypothetical protein